MRDIILASQSPRRAELIKQIKGINVKIVAADVDENLPDCDAEKLVTALAKKKAEAVQKKCGGLVLGADTAVCCNGQIFGKPSSPFEAKEMLEKLCGKEHFVYTGICLTDGQKTVCRCEKSRVRFNDYNENDVDAYIKTDKSLDKAGAYGIQDKEFKPILKEYSGDINNIIGLPVALVEKTLKESF